MNFIKLTKTTVWGLLIIILLLSILIVVTYLGGDPVKFTGYILLIIILFFTGIVIFGLLNEDTI